MKLIYIIIAAIIICSLLNYSVVENYRRVNRRSDGRTGSSRRSVIPTGFRGSTRNKARYVSPRSLKRGFGRRRRHTKFGGRGGYSRSGYYNYPYYPYYNYYYNPYLYNSVYYDLMFDPYYDQSEPVLNEYNCKTVFPCQKKDD